jgi:hypothetical protein
MYHVVYCLWVVLAEVNRARLCFSERVAASTIEESRSRADDSSVDGVFFHSTGNFKVRIFPKLKQTGPTMLDQNVYLWYLSKIRTSSERSRVHNLLSPLWISVNSKRPLNCVFEKSRKGTGETGCSVYKNGKVRFVLGGGGKSTDAMF